MDDFDPPRVMNTIKFLERAAKSHGFERKIVTNLLYVRYYQYSQANNAGNGIALFEQEGESLSNLRDISYLSFDSTLFMLNESLGLCLR
ncbi:hypothetical protein KEM56_006392 [Ascosphaera pollenicola]|nr:hypothetical protein KEM56_006392 [Ascosphaera pollenicola]